MKRSVGWVAVLLISLLALRVFAATTQPAGIAKVRIVLAGDSTVNETTGWGRGFESCFTDDAQVINMARGGRSSKSFIAEGLWKKCLDLKPDYVLIQFGHNDSPGHPDNRETDPQTTYKQYMTQYVHDARAAGITPILITSVSRRQWGEDGKIHSTLVPYVEVVKQIAAEKNVPLIDLHARSIELYEKIGKDACNALSPLKTPTTEEAMADTAATQSSGRTMIYDGTHFNAKGSAVIGPIVARELKKAVPKLAQYMR